MLVRCLGEGRGGEGRRGEGEEMNGRNNSQVFYVPVHPTRAGMHKGSLPHVRDIH